MHGIGLDIKSRPIHPIKIGKMSYESDEKHSSFQHYQIPLKIDLMAATSHLPTDKRLGIVIPKSPSKSPTSK